MLAGALLGVAVGASLAAAPAARAARVLVMSARGQVTLRQDPYLTGPASTPATNVCGRPAA